MEYSLIVIIVVVIIAIILAIILSLITCSTSIISEKFTSNKPRILNISCYGYGNMGDNMYSETFIHYLKDCEIIRINDSTTFVDSNKKLSRWLDIDFDDFVPLDFDVLIFGGGGIITPTKLKKSRNMMYYFNIAKSKGIKVYLISCGVQAVHTQESFDSFDYYFKEWKEIFDYASLITVRSPTDKELVKQLTSDHSKVHYFRDIGYIYPHTIFCPVVSNKDRTITIIMAGPVHCDNQAIRALTTGKKVVVMNMGARTDDNNLIRIEECSFPEAKKLTKYYGSSKAPEINFTNVVLKSDLDLYKVIQVIKNSELVLTGRYHGMIFARTLGVLYDTMGMDTNKIQLELPSNGIKEDIIDSYKNIKLLREHMGLPDNSARDMKKLLASASRIQKR
jgi:hypothetical protein